MELETKSFVVLRDTTTKAFGFIGAVNRIILQAGRDNSRLRTLRRKTLHECRNKTSKNKHRTPEVILSLFIN